jgi:hypothetical protein
METVLISELLATLRPRTNIGPTSIVHSQMCKILPHSLHHVSFLTCNNTVSVHSSCFFLSFYTLLNRVLQLYMDVP